MIGPFWAAGSPDGPCASVTPGFSVLSVSSAGITGEVTEHPEVEAGLACAQGFSIAT